MKITQKSKYKMICLSGAAAERLEALRNKLRVSYSSAVIILIMAYDEAHKPAPKADMSVLNKIGNDIDLDVLSAQVDELMEK